VIAHSHSLLDMLVWGAIGFVLQLLIYWLVHLKMGELERLVRDRNLAAGVYLGACQLTGGIVVAACLIP